MIRDQQCGLLNKKIQERTRAAIAMSIFLPTNYYLLDVCYTLSIFEKQQLSGINTSQYIHFDNR